MTDDEIAKLCREWPNNATQAARAIIAAYQSKLLAEVEMPERFPAGYIAGTEHFMQFDDAVQYAAAAAAQARVKALDEAMLAVNSGVLGHGECAAAIESLKGKP